MASSSRTTLPPSKCFLLATCLSLHMMITMELPFVCHENTLADYSDFKIFLPVALNMAVNSCLIWICPGTTLLTSLSTQCENGRDQRWAGSQLSRCEEGRTEISLRQLPLWLECLFCEAYQDSREQVQDVMVVEMKWVPATAVLQLAKQSRLGRIVLRFVSQFRQILLCIGLVWLRLYSHIWSKKWWVEPLVEKCCF